LPRVFGLRGVWGDVSVGIDLFLAEFLRVLGRFSPGLIQGLSLGLVSDLAIRFCIGHVLAPNFFTNEVGVFVLLYACIISTGLVLFL
jgi:hypothetical protein